jgi:YEATS domain-containing protein 4
LNLFFHVAYAGFLQLLVVSLLSTFPPLQNPVKRVKGVELTVPIAYGTISFWLGKKAEE